MPLEVVRGELIWRGWDRVTGLRETSSPFSSLDDLYAYCLSIGKPESIDRIIIRGQDEHDRPCVLTFVFQSITVSPQND